MLPLPAKIQYQAPVSPPAARWPPSTYGNSGLPPPFLVFPPLVSFLFHCPAFQIHAFLVLANRRRGLVATSKGSGVHETSAPSPLGHLRAAHRTCSERATELRGGGAVRRKESWGRETYQETGVTQLIVTVIATVITTAH